MDSYHICYNLFTPDVSEIPCLPEAFVIATNSKGISYIEKQATQEVLTGYALSFTDTPHEKLIQICDDLKPTALERRFKSTKRKKNLRLNELLLDSKTKTLLLEYVYGKLLIFYSFVSKHQYRLCYHLQRKDPIEGFELTLGSNELLPILEFTKKPEGIEYSFSLKNEEHILLPKDHDIVILLNDPAWIIVDKRIYQIKNLNANKLKPFFKTDKITIAQKHIKMYLEKVIIPVIKNIDVITNGFDIITFNKITSYGIEVVQDFMQDRYVIKVFFEYNDTFFDYHSPKTIVSNAVVKQNDHIQITQTKRDATAEQEIISLLLSKELVVNNTLLLETKASQDSFAIIEWLKQYSSQLEEEGFTIKIPNIEGKKINTDTHQITIESEKENDWFDIKGVVTINQHKIPFSRFISYIKQNQRLFPLSEEEIFIIPQEWMARYKKLADFGNVTNDTVRIPKSNYTLLEEVTPIDQNSFSPKEKHIYTPSPKLKATLRPYQYKGVQWLINHYYNGLGACLADDMGLGKTLQTIAVLVHAKEQIVPKNGETQTIRLDLFTDPLEVRTYLKALIVLPSSLLFNWAQELLKFAPHLTITKYAGNDRKKIVPYLETYDVILTTYTTAAKDIDILEKVDFSYLITDESQQLKNAASKIFIAINRIQTQHKISLSGTPIENSLSDLWSQMESINPGILGSFSFFKDHFKTPIEKNQNQERIQELKTLIDPFILRRTKEQVAKDLPELSEQTIYTEMLPNQKKQYESLKSAARNLLLGISAEPTNKIHIINTLTKLRQLANHPQLLENDTSDLSGKFEDVTHYLTTLIKSNKKVLIFSSFVSHLDLYQQWCIDNNIPFVTLTGQTQSADREKVVNEFQENEDVLLFFISLKAGGVGLNLTKASYVVLLDPWWNPFIEKQAIARAHRIGQTNKVMVSRFIAKDSIEEKILQLQQKKKGLSDEIIEINTLPDYIDENLDTLLR